MENVIKIISSNVKSTEQTSIVSYNLNIKESTFILWYKFDSKFLQYLNADVGDPIVVCLLPYALHYGLDIKVDMPINETILYNLNNVLIPVMSKQMPNFYRKITIFAKPTSEKYHGCHTGVGVSGGVDSFYTILKNIDSHPKNSHKNIDTFCIFNVGSHKNGDIGRELYLKRQAHCKKINDYFGKVFMSVDSNVDELYLKFVFEATHVFRTLSVPLLFQKYFSTYYFSSGIPVELFKFDDFDPAYYDLFSLPNISTSNLSFISVGSEVSRLDKVTFISQYEVATKYLNVCFRQLENCSKCLKCKRTILDLYITGNLDKYKLAFDIDYFYKNKNEFLQYAYSNKTDADMMEIYLELKRRKEFKLRHFIMDKILYIQKLNIFKKTSLLIKRCLHLIKRCFQRF